MQYRRFNLASAGVAALLIGCFAVPCSTKATETAQTDYMLSCQGCHLGDGQGFPDHGVPMLTGYVGNFLKVAGGREFLVQVPGSAQSNLSDARLAALLNWMLRSFSPNEVPADFAPYTAAEVGRLRARPLVAVRATRADLVRRIGEVAAAH